MRGRGGLGSTGRERNEGHQALVSGTVVGWMATFSVQVAEIVTQSARVARAD